MKRITKVLTGAALVAAAVFTVGCEKKSAEAQTIKIGAMYALSGDKAELETILCAVLILLLI